MRALPLTGPPSQTRRPGERWRAVYASDPAASRGRLIAEAPSPTRSEFQRDRDRILHSAAFRRLQHKTQVFVYHEGDSFRSRLTHTLEVSQIARALSRSLGLDEDLAEAVALSHDLGHTPFGHVGEDALDDCMAAAGGFDHNAQALRIVTRLERRYAAFDGLNLAWETLEGLVKHNGPLVDNDRLVRDVSLAGPVSRGVPLAILAYDARHPLDLAGQAGLEAQAAAIADDIAYDAHDIDDGLRAGLLDIEEMRAVPFLDALLVDIDRAHPALPGSRRIHELTRRVITRLVEDAVAESRRRIASAVPGRVADVRSAPGPLVGFSPEVAAAERAVKHHLFANLYRHPRLMDVRRDADRIVRDLFRRLVAAPDEMPADWRDGLEAADETRRFRRVADYVAGMTDRYAILEHRRLFATTPDLRIV